MIEFIKDNWLFLTIVGGVLLIIVIIYIIYSARTRYPSDRANVGKSHRTNDSSEIKVSLQDLIDSEILTSRDSDPSETAADVKSSKPEAETVKPGISIDHEDAEVKQTAPMAMNSLKPEANDLMAEKPPKPDEVNKPNETKANDSELNKESSPKKELGKYHVLYRKADRMWYVKREGSNRVLRVLETQREAIAYATIKAITDRKSVV
jgi:hypothetical protein